MHNSYQNGPQDRFSFTMTSLHKFKSVLFCSLALSETPA